MFNYQTLKTGKWNLTDLIQSSSGTQVEELVSDIKSKVASIENMRSLLRSDISNEEFLEMLHMIEEMSEKLTVLAGFAHLQYYSNTMSNEAAAFVTRIDKFSSEIENRIVFLDLWFKQELDEVNAERLISGVPSDYKEYLRHKRLAAKYSLAESEEKIISTLEVSGASALVKIYDRMTTAFEFAIPIKEGKKTAIKKILNKEKLLSMVRSHLPKERENAYKALWKVYGSNAGILGEIYTNVVLRWHDENISIRGFNSPISVRNLHNNIDDATVETLLRMCNKNSSIFREFFIEKAKILGVDKLRRYDLYAPISKKASSIRKYRYGKAAELVLETFKKFDPRFFDFARRLFLEDHVDSEIRRGKLSGAFCYTISPKRTPYVLLNYDSKTRDVSTMAHEFGHAIHSMAASDKSILVSHAPLPLAETASVFAEMLLTDTLLGKLSRQERRILLAEQVDDMYATIMRQGYFTLFELEAHDAIVKKNETIDKVADRYLNNVKEQFGNSVIVSPDFKWEWLYIPHFYHTPFYCYAYSFGNLLVLSLYQKYIEEGESFVPKYLQLLGAGGSQKPEELLKSIGMDITKDSFWQHGFDFIDRKMTELKDS
ncbi:MAG TPA: M3 family oligoendopeptidase [Nitrososphaeraceae archaeon]